MSATLYKLVVFVPATDADKVRKAIGAAGGGKLGNYSFCSFSSKGIGRFKPDEGANPHIGAVDQFEEVVEERIEVTVHKDVVGSVISAMKQAHPYDEVAFDLYLLEVWE